MKITVIFLILCRPKAAKVLDHPLFWDSEKRLSFLSDTSVQVGKNSVLSKALEDTAHTVLGTKQILGIKTVLGWNNKVDNKIYVKGEYNFRRVRDLLRLIQNMFNNREQLTQDIQVMIAILYCMNMIHLQTLFKFFRFNIHLVCFACECFRYLSDHHLKESMTILRVVSQCF